MKRWKRLVRCVGGTRCADVVLTDMDVVPPGAIVHIEYTCGGCGTLYHWDSGTQERRIVDQPTPGMSRVPSVLPPGGTDEFIIHVPNPASRN